LLLSFRSYNTSEISFVQVCAGVYKGVTTAELDELAAETAAAMQSQVL
jgi:hypothetical protein